MITRIGLQPEVTGNPCGQELTLTQLPTWWWVLTSIVCIGAIYFIWDSIRG